MLPVIIKSLRPVTVSLSSLPNTALPVTVKASSSSPAPASVPKNETVVPVKFIAPDPEITVLPA